MKRTISRILSLILVLTILVLPGAALAEHNLYSLTLGNFEINANGQPISLPVNLTIGGGADAAGERGALLLGLGAGDKEAINLTAVLENSEIRATLNGLGYNLYLPGEQLVAMAEEQMAGSPFLNEEATAKLERLMNAYGQLVESAMNAEPQLVAFINLPEEYVTVGEEKEITLFDTTVTARQATLNTGDLTLNQLIEKIPADEPIREYWDAYLDFMQSMLPEMGAEISVSEVLDQVTLNFSGEVYNAENAAMGDISMAVTVEDETLTIPMSFATLWDEENARMNLVMPITIDGETLTMQIDTNGVITQELTSVQYDLKATMDDGEETAEMMNISYSIVDDANGKNLSLRIAINDGFQPITATIDYAGSDAITVDDTERWEGILSLSASNGEETYGVNMSTILTAGNLPEGELLAATDADINVLELTDELLQKLSTDAQNLLMQGLGVLMEDPTIAGIVAGMNGTAEY